MLEGTIRRIADMQVMKQLTVDDLVKLRPDIGDLIVGPPVIGPIGPIGPIVGGAGTPAPIPTDLPTIPGDVRPGDLIKADDWNAVLALLRALEPMLAALAQGTAQLTGRVNALASRLPADGGPGIQVRPELDITLDFLGSRAIREAIAKDPGILETIAKSPAVTEAIKKDPDLLTIPVLNRATGPVGPEVEGGPAVMLDLSEAESAALKDAIGGSVLLSGLVKEASIAETFGLEDFAADLAKGGAAGPGSITGVKTGAAKTSVAKASTAKTSTAGTKAASAKTKPPGGGG
jgi:hypothetical protein